jgi:hypothetical protein
MSTFPGELHPDRSEPFDELATDMDRWKADSAAAHARIDSALSRIAGETCDHGPGFCARDHARDALRASPSADILPERSAARDSWTLDRISELLTHGQGLGDPELLGLIRSTGRTC